MYYRCVNVSFQMLYSCVKPPLCVKPRRCRVVPLIRRNYWSRGDYVSPDMSHPTQRLVDAAPPLSWSDVIVNYTSADLYVAHVHLCSPLPPQRPAVTCVPHTVKVDYIPQIVSHVYPRDQFAVRASNIFNSVQELCLLVRGSISDIPCLSRSCEKFRNALSSLCRAG
ncbi:uncharacterized protein EDB91DRAFT_543276 [Suillus paluster]|uniref:uncharacterized protein n=1 Tax=Suillus paluster TaxID=48578 RepID=UPI001B86EB0B|nr:uncharacterized protein EDB91DRAFT_543276 [Suillus paluster]KAG1735891.1 hypothetical protein EDB91DRAFT_543276 [Suillus paluster]